MVLSAGTLSTLRIDTGSILQRGTNLRSIVLLL